MRFYENNEVDKIKFVVVVSHPTYRYEFDNLNDAVSFFQMLVFASVTDPSGIKLVCTVDRKEDEI